MATFIQKYIMNAMPLHFVNLLLLVPCLALAQAPSGAKLGTTALAASTPASVTVKGYNRDMSAVVCTTEPRSEWLTEDEMKLLAEHRGYRIKTFKVAKSNCYEVYGFDREGRIVEAYFNPITSKLIRKNIVQ